MSDAPDRTLRESERYAYVIKKLEGTVGGPPTSADLMYAISFLQEKRDIHYAEETKPRPEYKCPDPDYPYDEHCPYPEHVSPDGRCVYSVEHDEEGKAFVWIKQGPEMLKHYELPPIQEWVEPDELGRWPDGYYTESCIFCGHPSERK